MAKNPLRTYTNLFHVVFVLFGLSAVTLGFWALYNQPEKGLPPWPDKVDGFAYAPFRADQSPAKDIFPTEAQIDEDMVLLAKYTHKIRTYSVAGIQGEIPRIAAKHGLKVTVGAWLSDQMDANRIEIDRLLEVVKANKNINRIILGNETLLRQELTSDQLIAYIHEVKAAVKAMNRKIPVSTADSWDFWLKYPELAKEADFIGAHILPYWQSIDLDNSLDALKAQQYTLANYYRNKPVLLAEVGWPSRGRERGDAQASPMDEATFLRRFLALAEENDYQYFIMEAFDQPWKQRQEGSVGAYWGVWDADRQPKFPLQGMVREIPEWRLLVAVTVAMSILMFLALLADATLLRRRALSFLAVVAFVSTSALVIIAHNILDPYASVTTIVFGVVLALSAIGVITVMMVEAHEWAEAMWSLGRKRHFGPVTLAEGEAEPRVSIHIPCYNEPPEMVIATLDALQALEYSNYEVIVVDNNTRDETVWKPVEVHCQALGEKFRFFHVSPLAGFKAGALNFALRETDPAAEVVAVIDSDYQVYPEWLKELTPHFRNSKIAIVQAPQDYRDGTENLFKTMCYAEYQGFFHIGMVTRNDRNAIIQHGTMTMVRRKVLDKVKGWDESCITEDAELGLRVFNAGYEAAYIEKSYGQGLIPDNFIDYRKQRFRWAYGAMDIMRKHARPLFLGGETRLTLGQRYHFIAGWLPWVADGLNLFFTLGALLWSTGMIGWPVRVDPPLAVFAIPPLILFLFKLLKLYYLYRYRVGASHRTSLQAAFAGLSLSYIISKAMLTGLLTSKVPFLRTPKLKNREAWWYGLMLVAEETFIAVALWLCALGVAIRQDISASDVQLWVLVLLIQSTPYVAAIVMSLISSRPVKEPAGEASASPAADEGLPVGK